MRFVLVAASSLLCGCGLFVLSPLVDGVGGGASASAGTSSSSVSSSSTGVAPAFCDTVTATHCFDFDGDDALAPFVWEQYASTADHGLSSERARSAPTSLWVDFPAVDPPGGGHHAFYLEGSPTHVVLDVDLFRETAADAGAGVLDMKWDAGDVDCQLGIWLGDAPARVGFYYQRQGPASGMSMGIGEASASLVDLSTTIGEWMHLTAEVTITGGTTTISVAGAGGEARDDTVTASPCDDGPDPGSFRVSFGAYYNGNAFRAFYDNAVIQAD